MQTLFRKHIWMVYSRPVAKEREEMKACGIEGADTWEPVFTKPVSYARASWVARDKENKFVETKIERVA